MAIKLYSQVESTNSVSVCCAHSCTKSSTMNAIVRAPCTSGISRSWMLSSAPCFSRYSRADVMGSLSWYHFFLAIVAHACRTVFCVKTIPLHLDSTRMSCQICQTLISFVELWAFNSSTHLSWSHFVVFLNEGMPSFREIDTDVWFV